LGNKKGKPSQRQQPVHKEEEKDYREIGGDYFRVYGF